MKKCCTTLAVVLLLASCNTDEYLRMDQLEENAGLNSSNLKSKSDYTGKELFESIYFGASVLDIDTEYFHSLREFRETLSPDEQQVLTQTTQRIVSEIEQIDNNFFDRFKESLYSKDYYRIENEFKAADKIVEEAIGRIPEYSEPYSHYKEITKLVNLEDYMDPVTGKIDDDRLFFDLEHEHNYDIQVLLNPTLTFVALGVVLTVGVFVNYGAVLNVGVAVYSKVYTPWDKQIKRYYDRIISRSSSLQNEMFINDLVNEI